MNTNSYNKLIAEIALIFNKNMYNANYISFSVYKSTENTILSQINKSYLRAK